MSRTGRELRSRLHPSLHTADEEDHARGGRDRPGEVDPRICVVTHPRGVQGAQIRGQHAAPEEDRFRHTLGIPQPSSGREVRDEADALNEDIGDEGVLGDEPEHDHSCASRKAQSLHAVEGYCEGATPPVELDDVVQNVHDVQRTRRDGDVARPRFAWTLPVHPAREGHHDHHEHPRRGHGVGLLVLSAANVVHRRNQHEHCCYQHGCFVHGETP